MTLDSRIRSVLNQEVSTVEAPWPPPLDDLVVAGETEVRRRRGRRQLAGTIALAAVLVVSVPAAIALRDGPDGTRKDTPVAGTPGLQFEELPVGAPPTSLYCLDGVARWGTEELPLADGNCASWPHRFAEAGGVAAVVDAQSSLVTVFTADGVQEPPTRADSASSPVVFSPDGDLVAWVSKDRVDGRQEVVLWDTERGKELKRAQAPTPNELNLEGMDGSGRIYMTSVNPDAMVVDRIWVWASRQDEGFRQVVGLGEFVTVADVPPDGLAILKTLDEEPHDVGDPQAVGLAVWGTVTARGKFVLGPVARVRPVVWSPDRSRYVAVQSATVISRTSDGDGARVPLRLPSDATVANSPSWESEDQVLVPVDLRAPGVAILRCSAGTGRCEVAATGRQGVALPGDDADNLG